MPETDDDSGGLLAGARRLGRSALGLLQTRLELLSVELQEEKLRTLNLLGWLVAAVALALAGFLLVIATLALFLWRTAGYPGLIGLAVVVLGASWAIFALIRRRIRRGPAPFSATRAEFRKDMECLRNET